MQTNKKLSFSWVLVDELMVGSAPLHNDHLMILKREGINSVLTLCSSKEVNISKDINNYFTHNSFILPDHTFKKYPQTDEIISVLEILEDLIRKGPVYVHCFAGIERSPLICMAWLISKHKLSPQRSLDYLMEVHKGSNPLPSQYKLLSFL